jgi:ribosome-associated protein
LNKTKSFVQTASEADTMNEIIVDSIRDIKGKNIIKMDLRHIPGSAADFFIICEGDSSVQVSSIAGNVYKRMKNEMSSLPISYEGKNNSTWVLVDYFTTVVHVFYKDTRKFYNLESLWNDAKVETYSEI